MSLRIARLDEVDPGETRFGGKACGLARLRRCGAPVPEAWLVSATSQAPRDWTDEERAAFREAAGSLLLGGPIAVRSSAVAEDSKQQSFAGLFETVLDVRDVAAAEEAAARCIGSALAERVTAYARVDAALAVGLVLQRQVVARAAGVCFTRDPVGRDRALVIEAVAGLGERLVSGQAEPERWRVYRNGLGRHEARRESGPPVLREPEVLEIGRRATDLEERLGQPLDLEWALEGAAPAPWWLQARPITAAAAPPELSVERGAAPGDDGPVTVWSNFNVRETMPEPFTPMNWSVWREVVLPSLAQDLFGVRRDSPLLPQFLGIDLVDGRLYWNMNALLAGPLGMLFRARDYAMLSALDGEAARFTRELARAGVLRPRRIVGGLRLTLRAMVAGPRALLRLLTAARPRRALDGLRAAARDVQARPPVEGLADEELLREATLFADPIADRFRGSMQTMALGMLVHDLAHRAFASQPRAQALLTAGVVGPTTAISVGIDRLAERARPIASHFLETTGTHALFERLRASAEGRLWLAGLESFLEENGQRCPKEFELATPRWSENPAMIVDLVRGALRAGARSAGERLARAQADRREAIENALAATATWRRPLLRWLARKVGEFMPLREAPKHYTMHLFLRMRRALVEVGRRLVAHDRLDRAEDVFFLQLPELRSTAEDLRERVSARRVRWDAFQRRPAPHFVRSDGVPVGGPPEPRADGSLVGVGVCGGVASGTARVLREPDPSQLSEGDVLIVEFADPGWTPLFPRVSAVVMEVGGTICHAAVVARELGVPAVFGVAGATRAGLDGIRVTVDGDRGTVMRA